MVLLLVTHEFRTRWRGWAVFVLLVAFTGGALLTAAAGARRTSSAYPRFLRASHASDLLVSVAGTGTTGFYGALARQPGVALVARDIGLNVQPADRAGRLDWAATTQAPAGRLLGHGLDAPRVLAGRLPRLDRADEVAVDQTAAADLDLHVGSTLTMEALPNQGPPGSGPAVRPRRLRERVVGVVVTRSSVDPVTDNDKVASIQASPALTQKLGPGYRAFDGAFVKLAPGATAGLVSREAQALARKFPATLGQAYVDDESEQVATVERGIRPEAIALAIFALALACTALLIVGQAATRLLLAAGTDNPVLAALGLTRGQMLAAALIETAVASTAGAILAAGVAIAASPLMPIGAARLAEPGPGVSADWLVLSAGAVIIVVLLAARTLWPAWRLASVRESAAREAAAGPGRRSWLAGWLAGVGAPVTMTAGARLATEPGQGRTAVPVRAALAGTTLSVLAVTAAFTFGANLLHLVHSPRLYGQAWDAAIDLQFSPIQPSQAQNRFGTIPGVTGWTYGDHGIIGINGHLIPAIGLTPGRGPLISPTLLAGRPPRTGREIVLGSSTLHDLGLHVGQQVPVTVDGRQVQDRIVGQAVFPNFGQGSFTPTDLGEGAETTAAVLRPQAALYGERSGFQVVLLRFARGPGRSAAITRFRHSMAGFCADVQQSTCVELGQRPNGVTNYALIDGTPEVLAGLLAALGVAVLTQLSVVSGRRRRHDFAVLRALGLLRRQVSQVAAWQVSTLAGLALLIGLPLGVAAGRWSWHLFAAGLGVSADASLPVTLLLVMVPAVLIIANAVALWPGRSAARVSPARALRTE